MKFTFKRLKKITGLAGIGYTYPNTQIKLNRLQVGLIVSPSWSSKTSHWKIKLAIKEGNGFQWITLKFNGKDEADTRNFLIKNCDLLVGKYDLYSFPKEDETE